MPIEKLLDYLEIQKGIEYVIGIVLFVMIKLSSLLGLQLNERV